MPRVRTTPAREHRARRARSCPSYTPQLPPTSTSSSMTTGDAFTGSSTPPICAAALRCTRSPICAHEPTSACESTIVPAPTYAPTLTYIGGMQTTPGARYAPRRTDEPPGHDAHAVARASNARGGYVCLSKNGARLVAAGDMSTSCADAKAEQDAALHPRHGAPRSVVAALRGAHLAALERVEQLVDERLARRPAAARPPASPRSASMRSRERRRRVLTSQRSRRCERRAHRVVVRVVAAARAAGAARSRSCPSSPARPSPASDSTR